MDLVCLAGVLPISTNNARLEHSRRPLSPSFQESLFQTEHEHMMPSPGCGSRHRQRINPPHHAAKQQPRQVALHQQQPVVERVSGGRLTCQVFLEHLRFAYGTCNSRAAFCFATSPRRSYRTVVWTLAWLASCCTEASARLRQPGAKFCERSSDSHLFAWRSPARSNPVPAWPQSLPGR